MDEKREPKYYLRILLVRDKDKRQLFEAENISEVHAYNIIKLYNSVLCSLDITLREVEKWEQTGKK